MYYYVKSTYNVNPVCPRAALVQLFRNAVRVWPECGRLTAGLFLLGVRPDRTPSKNGPESQGPREGQMRTACSTSTVPGVASIAVRSARDRSSDYMHAFSISDDLIP